jgi:anti-sigma regulatory factor (Ser/Thr protein kinase)
MAQRSSRWELAPDPHRIGPVRRAVVSFAAHAGMPATAQTDLQVAVSDAITSAVLQAGADRASGPVRVVAEQLADELVVRVRESGRPADAGSNYPALGPRLSMIAALAQGFGVRRCGGGATELSMRFALGGGR